MVSTTETPRSLWVLSVLLACLIGASLLGSGCPVPDEDADADAGGTEGQSSTTYTRQFSRAAREKAESAINTATQAMDFQREGGTQVKVEELADEALALADEAMGLMESEEEDAGAVYGVEIARGHAHGVRCVTAGFDHREVAIAEIERAIEHYHKAASNAFGVGEWYERDYYYTQAYMWSVLARMNRILLSSPDEVTPAWTPPLAT